MLKKRRFPIDMIYVPLKRARTLDADRVLALAEDILENGHRTPISLRPDGKRFVLIFHLMETNHRLRAGQLQRLR